MKNELLECSRCGGCLFKDKDGNDWTCFQCGNVLYGEKRKPPATKVDKAERRYYGKGPGRHRTGEWRKCSICTKDIYVRNYRLKPSHRGKYCLECFRKYILPKLAKLPRRRIVATEELAGVPGKH